MTDAAGFQATRWSKPKGLPELCTAPFHHPDTLIEILQSAADDLDDGPTNVLTSIAPAQDLADLSQREADRLRGFDEPHAPDGVTSLALEWSGCGF